MGAGSGEKACNAVRRHEKIGRIIRDSLQIQHDAVLSVYDLDPHLHAAFRLDQ